MAITFTCQVAYQLLMPLHDAKQGVSQQIKKKRPREPLMNNFMANFNQKSHHKKLFGAARDYNVRAERRIDSSKM